MRKLAVFVEGQTEAVFIWKLVQEIAGPHHVVVEHRKAVGQKGIRTFKLVDCSMAVCQEYFVLIFDCGGDSCVKSDIRDQYDGLVSNGYEAIIGIRDVYPEFPHNEIPRLRRGLAFGMKTNPLKVVFALAVMEIEAWFIREYGHFERISPTLTLQRIIADLGFDPSQEIVHLRPHPTSDLDAIYRLAGYSYGKSRSKVARTVDALDYARIYVELRREIDDLGRIMDCLDGFFVASDSAK